LSRARLFWIVLALIGGALILLIVNDSSGSTLGLPNGSFANLVYLGVWGTVLAAGIVVSGRRLGDTARALAAWMLIILVAFSGVVGLVPMPTLAAVLIFAAVMSLRFNDMGVV